MSEAALEKLRRLLRFDLIEIYTLEQLHDAVRSLVKVLIAEEEGQRDE